MKYKTNVFLRVPNKGEVENLPTYIPHHPVLQNALTKIPEQSSTDQSLFKNALDSNSIESLRIKHFNGHNKNEKRKREGTLSSKKRSTIGKAQGKLKDIL